MRHTNVLFLAFAINTLLTALEYAAGVVSGSAALIADGSQNLTDSLIITVAFICERIAARPLTSTGRVAHIYRLAASINAVILMLLAIFIAILAAYRIAHPRLLDASLVVATGVMSVVINWSAAGLFFKARRDATIAAPYIGLLFSGLSGVGVIASGLANYLWGLRQIDGIVGVVIASILFIRSSYMLSTALWRPKAVLKKISQLPAGWLRLP